MSAFMHFKQDCIPEWPDKEFHMSLVLILSRKGDTGKGNLLPGHFSLRWAGTQVQKRWKEEMAMWTVRDGHTRPWECRVQAVTVPALTAVRGDLSVSS